MTSGVSWILHHRLNYTKSALLISTTWLIVRCLISKRRSTVEDVWSLHEDGVSLTKGTATWIGAQWNTLNCGCSRVLEFRPVWELERHKSGSPPLLLSLDPHLKQLPDQAWCTRHMCRARAEKVLDITVHVAMVWDSQPQNKLSKTRTRRNMKATKGLIFKMVELINVSSAELQTSAMWKAQTLFFGV